MHQPSFKKKIQIVQKIKTVKTRNLQRYHVAIAIKVI